MSIGYGGYADLQQADDTMAIYSYCCYNANNADYKHFMEIEDGELYIDRDAFVEPEIHEKIKKMVSGSKNAIVKSIKKTVPFGELFKTGKIIVKNASGTWRTTEFGTDIMSLKILLKIFNKYQETGSLPEHVNWFS